MKSASLIHRFSQPVSRLVMRMPKNSPAALVLAVTLAASAAAVNSRSSASKIQTPDSKIPLLSYFAEWHGTAVASSSGANAAGGNFSENVSWESAGSAIIRYAERGPGYWIYQDSKLLNLVATFDFMGMSTNQGCGGTSIESYSLLDSGLNGVPIKLWTPDYALRSTTRRASLFFQRMPGRAQLQRHRDDGCGNPGNEIIDESPGPVFQTSDIRDAVNSPFDLLADKDDISSFSVHTHFKADLYGRQSDVDWSAHAYRLGSCASQIGPIEDGDPIIQHEDVAIDPAGDTEIEPNGQGHDGHHDIAGTSIKIRVTCDQVPIKDAEVEITVDPVEKTGGHNHEASRPGGKLNALEIKKANPDSKVFVCPCKTLKTDAKGYVTEPSFSTTPPGAVKFTPPHAGESGANYGSYESGVGGDYVIKARPTNPKFKSSEAKLPIHVHPIPKLEVLERTGYYFVCCPEEVEPHKANNYGASHTLQQFKALAKAFYDYQTTHNGTLQACQIPPWDYYHVSFNDIALEDGGVFDLASNWKPGHQTHNKGEGGDINRFNDISDSTTADDCIVSPTPPHKKKIKLRQWLMHNLLELGKGYGHWDCSDLHAGSPQHLTSAQCSNQENQELPMNTGLGHITNQQGQQIQDTLHLHVDD